MADVDNEGHGRPEGDDICKVLLWPHAHINAALFGGPQKIRNDVLKIELIGQQVVRAKHSILLRQLRRKTPELFIAQLRGDWRDSRGGAASRYRTQDAQA